ncbi:MAG: hypothetical protein K9M94_15380 [Spirochaetia bacterium]|nr:hypothetical protein [Spirochaetia bacterium]
MRVPVCLQRLGGIEVIEKLFEIEGKEIQVLDTADRERYRIGIDIYLEK